MNYELMACNHNSSRYQISFPAPPFQAFTKRPACVRPVGQQGRKGEVFHAIVYPPYDSFQVKGVYFLKSIGLRTSGRHRADCSSLEAMFLDWIA